MEKIEAADGRIAWFCGEDPDAAAEMAAELFPGVDVVISGPASPPRRSGRSPA